MNRINWFIWRLMAQDGDPGDPVESFESVLGSVLKELGDTIGAIQTPFMIAIAIVAGVTLLWRMLSSDDPQEMPRAIRTALIMVGGAAVVLYLVPPLLIAIGEML